MDTRIGVHGERPPIEEARLIEPALKRALYQCLERIHATKAALYLATTYGSNNAFELVTSYGWSAPPRALDERNLIVGRLAATRMPLMINSVAADKRVAEVLFEQGCERLLAMPMFVRGQIVGIIDLRDKAARKPFEAADVAAADSIREDIEKALASKNLYGIGAVVEAPKRRRGASAKYSGITMRPETLVLPDLTASPGALELIRP